MSIQVVKCNVCGARFNGTEHAQCPYCQEREDGKAKWKGWPRRKARPVQPGTCVDEPLDVPGPEPAAEPEPPTIPDSCPPESKRVGHTQPFWDPVPGPEEGEEVPGPEEPKEEEGAPQPEEPKTEKKPELKTRIQELGPTTAKYINTSGGDVTYPAVGWLVGIKGVYFGKSFPLKSGINTVGRSPDMDVPLLLDQSVSRKIAVRIGYDSRTDTFHAWAGESSEFCVISGNALYERVPLTGFEEIEFGDCETSKYIFVPLCGDRFRWSDYPTQN